MAVDFTTLNSIDASGKITPKAPSAALLPANNPAVLSPYVSQPSKSSNPYSVVTSGPATQNLNTIQTDYNNNIKPGIQNASVAKTQNESLPVIPGYNVSAIQTGNQGETKATNNATGQSYFIAPQTKPATAADLKGALSTPAPTATPPVNQTSPPNTQPQTGINPSTEDTNYQNSISGINDELTGAYNTFKNTVQQIQSGSFPLSSAQQSLVDATSNAFRQMTDQSNLKAAALSSETGGISTKVNATAGELTNITAQQSAAVARLEIGFQDQNYKMITESYNQFKDLESQKINSIEKLHNSVMDTYNKVQAQAQKVTDSVNAIALDAAKNGADSKTQAAIRASTDEGTAIAAAGGYLQTASGTLGDYLQYKRDAESKGLVPSDYQGYKDAEDAKALQAKIRESYATQDAKNKADASYTASDKTQQKLEQQYRTVLSKEFSSRTGALGVENAKVNQANHLNSLVTQYHDPKTGDYNIPKSQYAELVLGLANLISPSGVASDSLREEITQKTAKGDLLGAVTYVTGIPLNGTTQDVIKNLVDSIDRQAVTATQNREAALQNMRDQAPTDLDQSRIDSLNKSTKMVEYSGQDRVSKNTVNTYVQNNPVEAEKIAKLYEVPGATDQNIEEYLRAQGKLK